MSGPYRESSAPAVACPRCGDSMPAGELTGCPTGCGVWVNASASALFAARELAPSRLTSWFRERASCPACETEMTLRGFDMSRFLGCDTHGFWVDADTVAQTGLGASANASRLAALRGQLDGVRKERDRQREAERSHIALSDEQRAALARQHEEDARAAALARQQAEALRRAAAREAKRQRYVALVKGAVGNPTPLVEELMRMDDAVEALAARVTDLERAR